MTTFSQLPYAMDVTHEEIGRTHQWATTKFEAKIPQLPFSYVYGGQPSDELLMTWDLERSEKNWANAIGSRRSPTLIQKRAWKYDA